MIKKNENNLYINKFKQLIIQIDSKSVSHLQKCLIIVYNQKDDISLSDIKYDILKKVEEYLS